MVTSPKGIGHEKNYAGEGQQHIQKTERAPHKNKTVTVKE
jgi:hypothetical protein